MMRRVWAVRSAGITRTVGIVFEAEPAPTSSTYSEPKIVEGSTRAVTLAGIRSACSDFSTTSAWLCFALPLT